MQIEFEDRNFDQTSCHPDDYCPATGAELLDYYDLTDQTLTENTAVLVGFAVLTRVLAYFILRRNIPKHVKK